MAQYSTLHKSNAAGASLKLGNCCKLLTGLLGICINFGASSANATGAKAGTGAEAEAEAEADAEAEAAAAAEAGHE